MRFTFLLSTIIFIALGCNRTNYLMSTMHNQEIVKNNETNLKVNSYINPYKHKVDSITNSVIAFSDDVFNKEGDNYSLGNFSCDGIYYMAKLHYKLPINIVLLNKGGLRVNLPKGEIKTSNLFELMPFENELVVCKIKGKNIIEGSRILIDKKAAFLGMKLKGKNEKYELEINNLPIHQDSVYTILTSDYLANGGDNFSFLKNSTDLKFLNLKIRDALIEYCKILTSQNKTLKPYTDDRFSISK